MGALAIYLEDEGIPTVQVSLVREHTEALGPPRALWVPFILGRPLGVPNDPAFQKRVMLAVLKLLERGKGPVLEDFPEDAPNDDADEGAEGAACAVSFESIKPNATLAETVVDEIAALRMWHDLAIRHRGRTALGVSQAPVDELARWIAARAEGDPKPGLHAALPAGDALRQACEELKTYYFEARMAQPGSHTAATVREWFWRDTAAGRLFVRLQSAIENDSDPSLRGLDLIPRSVRHAIDNPRSL